MLDLLIRNGHVIDLTNRTDQVRNIAIYNDRVTRYEEGEPARRMMNATGRYVFPGSIDAHAHIFQGRTEVGIYPGVVRLPTGVTPAIDFSASIANYPILRSAVIVRSRVTIKGFLQICSAELTTTSHHKCIDPKFLNPERIVRMYHDDQDNILGLRIHQSEELTEGLDVEPLEETVRIVGIAGCPVEVHCTNIPALTSGVLKVLRPGDISEHAHQGVRNTIIDKDNKSYGCAKEVRKQGITFDMAERRKHGDLGVILKAKEQGLIADMCSTDLVLGSMLRHPILSLPSLMSRYIRMGIPMSQVVSMATERPAGLMKMQEEAGCPSEGTRADVAISRWMDFKQTYKDQEGTASAADKPLKPEMMVKDGQIMYCAPDYTYEDWA